MKLPQNYSFFFIFIIGLITLSVFSLIGSGKANHLVWGLSKDEEVALGDKKITYSQFDLDVMRLFVVVSIIVNVNSLISFFSELFVNLDQF